MSTGKRVPLTKDETSLLIQLVEDHKIVTSKVTNAANNRLKEEAWSRIKDKFNAAVSSSPRNTGQLRLKWDNMKKAARKRSAQIRMNELKTGSAKPDYIPPNDVLDRVAGILGVTCDEYKVPFDGDANHQGPTLIDENAKDQLIDMSEVELESEGSNSISDVYSVVSQNDTMSFATPKSNSAKKRSARHELTKSSILKNNAVADYFIVKKNKMMQQKKDHEEERTKLKEENIKLKEENLKLKEENIKLKEGDLKLKEKNIKLKEEDLKLKEENIKLKEEALKLKEENVKLKEEDLKLKADILNVRSAMLN